jgi:hypothetical protein
MQPVSVLVRFMRGNMLKKGTKDAFGIIPPRTVVKLKRSDSNTPMWKKRIGQQFRIGYYSKKDGLDLIWLVDENGFYCETTDREYLLKYFDIVKLSREKDLYGIHRKALGSLRK